MKQSFCIPCFQRPGEPLGELFKTARQIGYEAAELWRADDASLEQACEAARSAGLSICSFTGHDSIDHGLNDPDQWDRIEGELIHSIDLAARLSVPGIICFSGTRRPGVSDLLGLGLFVKGVRRVIGHAEEKGVTLNLEVLNSRLDHPLYMCDTVDWAIAACEAVGSPRLKILFDVYHVQVMEGGLLAGLRRAAPHLGHIHTAGVPGRHELDDSQEINYRAVGEELRRLGYTGHVGHELFPAGDPVEALRQAFACLQA